METWRHPLHQTPPMGPTVATLGNFDGVHAGHRAVLKLAAAEARSRNLPAVVVTFDPHPAVVVAPERKPRLLMTLDQRLRAFREAGMDLAWVIPFSRSFSELEPLAFLRGLQAALHPVELHVGSGFRFGRDRTGDIRTLEAWGAEAGCGVRGHAFQAPDGGHLSSTRIRKALDEGAVQDAERMLGHPYALTGIVVEGDRRGRHLGFPTANLAWEQEQLPARGVYVTQVTGAHLEGVHPGLTNVGEKPTFDGLRLTVETFVPGFEGDLYGAHLEVGFLHRLRPERRFDGLESLMAQIRQDVDEGVAWWRRHREGP